MKTIFKFSAASLVIAASLSLATGCATARKEMTPVPVAAGEADLLKGMEVVQEPALEPEWADFVKQHYPTWQRHYWVDRGQWGNRGFLVGKAETDIAPVPTAITSLPLTPVEPPTIVPVEPPTALAPAPREERPTTYVVKKGDSLWKIAGKVYGNPLKWGRLYKANKEKLKSANKIYPGQVLTVPWE
jgi:LysM repeat protein